MRGIRLGVGLEGRTGDRIGGSDWGIGLGVGRGGW